MERIFKQWQKEMSQQMLNEILLMTEQMASEGIPFEEIKKEILKVLQDDINKLNQEIMPPCERDSRSLSKGKNPEAFAEDNRIVLRMMTEEDREFYYSVFSEYSFIAKDLEGDIAVNYEDSVCDAAMSKNSLVCIVERKEDGAKIGYIGINDITASLCELEIELKKEYCGMHYGRDAIRLFTNKVSEVTGDTVFRARVEADNIPSQNCMNAVGAKLVGINNFLNYPEEIQKEFEEKNIEKITPHMRELAEELNIEPQKLLSNVLEYRISL